MCRPPTQLRTLAAVGPQCAEPPPACCSPEHAERTLSVMGIRSWFTSYWSQDEPGHRRGLVISRRKDRPKLEEIKRAASEDVARIEEDDKYFGSNAPSEGDAL